MAGPLPLAAGSVVILATLTGSLVSDRVDRQAGRPAAVVDSAPTAAAPTQPMESMQPTRQTGFARSPSFTWPLSPRPAVIRSFAPGPRPWSPGHRGVDLAGSAGGQVSAPAAGVVTFAGRVAGKGVVVLDHGGGLRTTYEPVQAMVAVGQRVVPGAAIGALELTASHCAPRACLHWGAVRDGQYIDPLSLIKGLRRNVILLPVG